MCVPNMKFVCLSLWLGEVCTYDAKDNDAQVTKHGCIKGFLVDKPKEPKTKTIILLTLRLHSGDYNIY